MMVSKKLGLLPIAALAALIVCGMPARASADLIQDPNIQVTGTGLGAVDTLITIHATGNDTLESGCITQTAAYTPCAHGVQGGDNIAINNVLTFDTDSSFVAVVNISETGQDLTVTLTHLYLTFVGENGTHDAVYLGGPINLTQGSGTGLGGSGFVFVLTPEQAAIVAALGPTVTVSGGMQFADGTTNDGSEALYVIQLDSPAVIPEPTSMLLFGTGLAGLAARARRRRKAGK